MKLNKMNFIIIFLLLNINLFSKPAFDDIFDKKLVFERSKLTPQELCNILSDKLEIKFVYKAEDNFTIVIEDLQNLSAKKILSFLEDSFFDFYIKFDEGKPYIYVKIKDSFKAKIQQGAIASEKIDVQLEGAPLKDIISTLKQITGKKIEIQRKEILERKTYLKLENIEWQEFLKKLSEEIGFNYEIKEDVIRIW